MAAGMLSWPCMKSSTNLGERPVSETQHVVHDQHLAIGRRTGVIPITGIFTAWVISSASTLGTHSSSSMAAPACSRAMASARNWRLGFLAALDLEAAEQVDRLRGQAEMRADRHAHLCQAGDRLRQPGPTLQLDHVAPACIRRTASAGLGHGMAGFEGQVGDDQEPLLPRFTQAV